MPEGVDASIVVPEARMKDLMDAAKREAEVDLAAAKASPLWLKAVEWIRGYLSEDVKADIRKAITFSAEKSQAFPDWPAAYHFGWGMDMRNDLRKQGFHEAVFRVLNLDNIWAELVEEAVALPALGEPAKQYITLPNDPNGDVFEVLIDDPETGARAIVNRTAVLKREIAALERAARGQQ